MQQHFDAAFRIIDEGIAEITLRVGVDKKNAFAAFLADRGEKPGRVRLVHSSHQVEDRDDVGREFLVRHAAAAYQRGGRMVER